MAVDVEALRKRLGEMQNQTSKSKHGWKPTEEEQTIRIVPYAFNKDNPFIELYFHWNIPGVKGFVSPMSFGKPDPFVELAEKLKATGDREKWTQGNQLMPKLRTFAPIIVRGKEHEGVKFWGFGKTVYTQLLGYFSDKKWGDLSDPTEGRDITVHQTREPGKDFPTTHVRPDPTTSQVVNTQELAQKIVDSQVEITTIHEEKSYQEILGILENFMNPQKEDPVSQFVNKVVPNKQTSEEKQPEPQQQPEPKQPDPPKPDTEEKQPEPEPAPQKPQSSDNIAATFDALFNK